MTSPPPAEGRGVGGAPVPGTATAGGAAAPPGGHERWRCGGSLGAAAGAVPGVTGTPAGFSGTGGEER